MGRDEAVRLATAEAGGDTSTPISFGWRLRGARLVTELGPGQSMPPPYWEVQFAETIIGPDGRERPTFHGGLVVLVSCSTGEAQGWNLL